MMNKTIVLILSGLLIGVAVTSWADPPSGQMSAADGHVDELKLPHGVIGVMIQVAADHIGEPAALYVMKVHKDGPAQEAGLRHGDEIVAINGIPVKGKSYEQVVSMIRGEPGTPVKLAVRGIRELTITRVASDKVASEGQPGSRGSQSESSRP